jgi:uncharacterized membrane protein SirB2
MRLSEVELMSITNRSTPSAQAAWFKRHFNVSLEYDTLGVILTNNTFEALVAKKYGLGANESSRPTVKLAKRA